MGIVLLILLGLIAFGVIGLSGSVAKLVAHHEKFLPEREPGERVEAGDALIVRAFGGEQVCTVKGLDRHPDGYLVVAAEPVGSSPV